MNDKITLEELRQTELYRREQTRPLREFLGKKMKQEPVAWAFKTEDGKWFDIENNPDDLDKSCGNCYPLYTAPKELSDEEIKALLNIALTLLKRFGDLTDENLVILKKASEK